MFCRIGMADFPLKNEEQKQNPPIAGVSFSLFSEVKNNFTTYQVLLACRSVYNSCSDSRLICVSTKKRVEQMRRIREMRHCNQQDCLPNETSKFSPLHRTLLLFIQSGSGTGNEPK